MKTVGLTGSIGMGKSTVAAMLRDLGIPVFDADAAVHELQGPGGRLVPAIESAFPGTTGTMGVDRQKLGALVLGNDAAMARLESIVHPAVGAEREAFLNAHRELPLVIFDIPLLFEKGGADRLDSVIVVSAPPDVQRARVFARPGMTPEKFDAILARQMPDAEKRARAHHVIDTGLPLDETRAQLAAVVACILADEGR
jgi:dephospho-CoA kinase